MNVLGKLGIVGFLAVLLGAGLVLAMGSKTEAPDDLDVNSVASDPSAYKGTIKVRGIVAEVSPSDTIFVLIDSREYRACGVVACASRFVQVRYAGSLPKVEDEVVVTGEVVSVESRYILEGKEVQRLGK